MELDRNSPRALPVDAFRQWAAKQGEVDVERSALVFHMMPE